MYEIYTNKSVCIPSKKLFTKRQSESICRREIKPGLNIKICLQMGRKTLWEMDKKWLPSFSPYPTILSKGFFLRVDIKEAMCGKNDETCRQDSLNLNDEF